MVCHSTNGVRAVICGARGKVRYSIVSSESGYTLQDHSVAVSRFQQKHVERNTNPLLGAVGLESCE